MLWYWEISNKIVTGYAELVAAEEAVIYFILLIIIIERRGFEKMGFVVVTMKGIASFSILFIPSPPPFFTLFPLSIISQSLFTLPPPSPPKKSPTTHLPGQHRWRE